jgi:hypothetical protein
VVTSGVVRFDARDGAIAAMRCGWFFGKTPKPHPPAPRVESVCAHAPH